MGSKKKDLEIIYSLQWKNKIGNGGDKANIIGMYDIPATTLNWEIFKSYLLKNSGTVGEDVKVSYITDSNREFPIESQTDFQIALYAFRRKARMGDIVNLKLDRVTDQSQYSQHSSRQSNDVETQFDNEAVSIVSSCCNADTPPEWFDSYMTKFKKNVSEEIASAVSSAVANIKPHTVSQPSCYHSRKSKNDSSKRRKLPLLTGDGPHEPTKEFIKSIRLENKLEHKLEKLENKSKKLKEKKLALFSKSSDSDVTPSTSNFRRRTSAPCESEDDILQMDASPVNAQQMVPHMLGGEIYLHQWKVLNSGKSAWTNETALMFTWGSKALRALDTIVSVPKLKPGETGTISVRLQIPSFPGQYECYFHFHHKGRRFGHWLGCQVIVDPFDLKGNKSVLETSYLKSLSNIAAAESNFDFPNPLGFERRWTYDSLDDSNCPYWPAFKQEFEEMNQIGLCKVDDDVAAGKVVRDVTSRLDDIKLQDPTDTNCSSDSDNQSIISLSDSNSSKGVPSEYVVVPIPDCFKLDDAVNTKEAPVAPVEKSNEVDNFDDNNNEDNKENAEKEKDVYQDAISSNSKMDIVMVTLPEANQDTKEYACVMVDGQMVKIPKMLIKSEYLPSTKSETSNSRSESPFTEIQNLNEGQENDKKSIKEAQDQPLNNEENDFGSHCSAAGSCFSDANVERNNRLFIFPQTCPGYEVLQGGNDFIDAKEAAKYVYYPDKVVLPEVLGPDLYPNTPQQNAPNVSNNPFATEAMPHVPNYQQTPLEERKIVSEPEVPKNEWEPPVHMVQNPLETDSVPEPSAPKAETHTRSEPEQPQLVHILPESLVNGAVNAVSNVARSVINRIVPQAPGRWVNGHWICTNPESTREANLQALAEMGFWNRDLNATLLARYDDDLARVVTELVQ